MKTQFEFTNQITELFLCAYRAGETKLESDWLNVKALWKCALDQISDIYRQFEIMRDDMDGRNQELCKQIDDLNDEIDSLKAAWPDEEVTDHHDAFDAMFPGCTPDDLPFPDVEDLTPASELMGGDE